MLTLQVVGFGAVALIALIAVLNPKFDDTLIQRIGLSLICFGATLRVFSLLKESPSDTTCLILIYGLMVYAIGTIIKLKRAVGHGKT